MATREEILGKIKSALENGRSDPILPPPPEVWPVEGLSSDALFEKFAENLRAAAGRGIKCADRADAAKKIAAELAELGSGARLAVKPGNEPFAEQVHAAFSGELEILAAPENPADADPKGLEQMSASLVSAEVLLADTGTAAIRARSAFERLLCYLAPVCLIVAKKSALREHLPHAWRDIGEKLASDANPKGEFLLMTGPSRTADIEKILILGVHGPKKVVVFVIDNE